MFFGSLKLAHARALFLETGHTMGSFILATFLETLHPSKRNLSVSSSADTPKSLQRGSNGLLKPSMCKAMQAMWTKT